MAEEKILDLYTEEAVRKILKAWYPYDEINVNEKVALKVYEIIDKSKTCSIIVGSMEALVGGPVGAVRKLSIKMIKEIRSVLKKVGNDQHAMACIKAIALAFRSQIRDLGM